MFASMNPFVQMKIILMQHSLTIIVDLFIWGPLVVYADDCVLCMIEYSMFMLQTIL